MLTRWVKDIRKLRPRERVNLARVEGVERLWTAQVEALVRLEATLGKAPERVPVLSRVADAAERVVRRRLQATTAVALEGYDDLNAKQVREQVRSLGHLDLVRLRRHEAATKARKSVLGDIDKEIARRLRPAEPDAVEVQAAPVAAAPA